MLREDHAFAPASGAADEIGVQSRLRVVARDDLLGDSGHLGVCQECKVEIGLLVAHERKVEGASFCFVPCIGAGHDESAREYRLVAGVVRTRWIGNDAIAASAALHHEVAVPGSRLGQGKSEADAEFLTVYALAAIDNSIDSAMCRQRADTLSAGVRRWDGRSGRHECGLGDFDAVELEASESGTGVGRLRLGS